MRADALFSLSLLCPKSHLTYSEAFAFLQIQVFYLLLCYQPHKVSQNTPFLLKDSFFFFLIQQTPRQLAEKAPRTKPDIVHSGLHFSFK